MPLNPSFPPRPRRNERVRPAFLLFVIVALLGAVGGPDARAADPPLAAPEHVVLVIVGGGVRAKDLLDGALLPAVKALAAEGTTVDAVASPKDNPWLAARDLLTGRSDEPDAPGKPVPAHPTVFEFLRAAGKTPAEQVWFVSPAGGDDLALAASTHAAFGPALGARTAHGDGAFGEPMKAFLDDLGRPVPVPETVWPLLRRLRGLNRDAAGPFLPDDVDAGSVAAERVERAVLTELDRRSLLVKGANPADQRALRAAHTLLVVHRPRLLVVRLTVGESAQESVAAYQAALRVADQGVERLRAAVLADPLLAARTAFVVATDTGRNAKPSARGTLDADDESPERRTAVVVLGGAGIRPGGKVKGARALVDVVPTLGRLLGVPTPGVTGRAWDEVLRLP
jgi:hypothetical protein